MTAKDKRRKQKDNFFAGRFAGEKKNNMLHTENLSQNRRSGAANPLNHDDNHLTHNGV